MFGSSGYLVVVNLYYEVPLCGCNLLCVTVLQNVSTLCTSNLFACCFSSRLLLYSTSALHFRNEVFPRFSVLFLAEDYICSTLGPSRHKT